MGEAAFDRDRPFLAAGVKAAAVICRTPRGNLHAGVLHRQADGTAAVLHLGWQNFLSYDWPWEKLWAAPDVEPERLATVATRCRLIWERFRETHTFEYRIPYLGTTFEPDGRLKFGPGAKGLTCAHFILAVFQCVGITIADEGDWPVRKEDDLRFLESLRTIVDDQRHIDVLARDVEAGCKRIWPEEVVGACEFAPPAKFAQASAAGARVAAKLAPPQPPPPK